MMFLKPTFAILGMASFVFLGGGVSFAQDSALTQPVFEEEMSLGEEFVVEPEASDVMNSEEAAIVEGAPGIGVVPDAVEAETFDRKTFRPLVFTYWEYLAIQDALKTKGLTRAVAPEELKRDLKNRDGTVKVKPPPEEREIRLSGIVYNGAKDWTIWLNEKRVTPSAIPSEIFDLKVYRDYIEFKWFDDYTERIFPIRLRPHQRFNIDTRIFLPG